VAVEANPLALAAVPHLGVVHGRHAAGAGALANADSAFRLALHVLEQELAQELAGCQQPALGPTVLYDSTAGRPSQFQEAFCVCHQFTQEGLPLHLVRPVQLRLSLETAAEIALEPRFSAHRCGF
jgi:hypothetical protein